MFGLFRKEKKLPVSKAHKGQERIADALVSKTLRFQKRWADFMQGWSEKFSIRSKRLILVLFCLFTGGYSVLVLVNSITGKDKHVFSVTRIKTSKNITHTGDENTKPSSIVSKRAYRNIVEFRRYMDSLSGSKQGKRIADSIINARPGLIDSIYQLERIYQWQAPYEKDNK